MITVFKKLFFSVFQKITLILSWHDLGNRFPIEIVWSRIFGFLHPRLHPPVMQVDGHTIYLDSIDSHRLSIYGTYEPFETNIMKKLINPGDVVIDIGANIGYYTLIFARLVGEKGKVFAFEPDPTNFSILQKNIAANSYNNVVLIQKAVSSRSGKNRLYLCSTNLGDHRSYDPHNNWKSIEIDSVSLDDYFKDYKGKIHFIKMDVQGAEGQVLMGMKNLVKKNKNLTIVSEFWPLGLKVAGVSAEQYFEILMRHGYKYYQIDEKKKLLEPISYHDLLIRYPSTQGWETNLLCYKGSILNFNK